MKKHDHPRMLEVIGSLAVLALAVGCSEPTTGRVTGSVTIDGAPAKTGSIAFFPVDGRGAMAGADIVDGKYAAEVAFGSAKVEIRVSKVVGEKKLYDAPNSPVKQLLAESLPARYNDASELLVEVKPGETEKNFELTTK
jgi:hypothetical protein